VQKALNSRAMAGALQNKRALVNPNTRAKLVATAATAGWLGGRSGRNAWWRHRHGGFGWVGPLFWPLAYYDIYDYALWGYGYDPLFWDYGLRRHLCRRVSIPTAMMTSQPICDPAAAVTAARLDRRLHRDPTPVLRCRSSWRSCAAMTAATSQGSR